jgi:hypothetical protein
MFARYQIVLLRNELLDLGWCLPKSWAISSHLLHFNKVAAALLTCRARVLLTKAAADVTCNHVLRHVHKCRLGNYYSVLCRLKLSLKCNLTFPENPSSPCNSSKFTYIELELALIQTQMTQTPMLLAEVHVRALSILQGTTTLQSVSC